MADSPLELYEKAYRLHYEGKNTVQACDVYEQIIREFPESNESGYAVIQLEKIKANKALADADGEPAKTSPVQIVSLALNLVAVVMLAVAFFSYSNMRKGDRQYVASLSQALTKAGTGQTNAALKILSDLEPKAPGDITPFALSADICARAGRFDEALAEYDKFRKLYPAAVVPQEAVAAIEQQRRSSRAVSAPPPVAVEEEEAEQPNEEPEAKMEKPAKKSESSRAASRPTPKPKAQPKPAAEHKDSVSFF